MELSICCHYSSSKRAICLCIWPTRSKSFS